MKALVSAHRRLREARMVLWALAHRDHPVLAHVVVIRRCNLACAYCNEYDKTSEPVPAARLEARLDKLAELGTSVVTLTGGEPTLHPDLDALIRRVRRHGMLAGLITNGFFLMPERIRRLNEAGLDHLQISIDNVDPDDVSVKSLKNLDRKLRYLAEHARFHVNINAVLGAARPGDVLAIDRRARELGFSTSTGVLHDGAGQGKPLGADELAVWRRVHGGGGLSWTRIAGFEENLVAGRPNAWKCRAGARYLYVCEDGLVHYCSQRRGEPGVPLLEYGTADVRREFDTVKDCAPNCTLGCVHRVSTVDSWRG
jgi:MoaA/NifB/PqqE/SkfB family radical SAM enzyme